MPYPDDDRLVMVYSSYPKLGVANAGTSIPDYLDRRAQAPSLRDLAILAPGQGTLQGGDGPPEQVSLVRASPSLFGVLGIAPVLGRAFDDGEAVPGNERVVVLSYRFWNARFGTEAAIGQNLRIDDQSYRVIGVMPRGFNFFNREIDVWLPFAITPQQMGDDQRGSSVGVSVGRLARDATVDGLNAEMDAIAARIMQRLPPGPARFFEAAGFTGRAERLRDVRVGDLKPMMLILQTIVAAVLLIACTNVVNLQLARLVGRRQELAVRTAIGAARWRLARLVLGEILALALVGGIAGLLLTVGGLELVRALGLDRSLEGFHFTLDPTVLSFTAGAVVIAAFISGLPPLAAFLRDDLARAINEGGRAGAVGPSARLVRSALVSVQLAASLALLVGAGLLTDAYYRLQQEGPGFDATNVWSASVSLPPSRYSTPPSRVQFYERALETLRAIPGVMSVGLTSLLPFSGGNAGATIAIDGYVLPDGGSAPPSAQTRSISHGYLDSLDIPVAEGRGFEARETDRVAIVDETMARTYWPDGKVLGQRIRSDADPPDQWYTVIGVVPSIKQDSLAETQGRPTIYWHYEQRVPEAVAFTVRTALAPEQLANTARGAIYSIDPDLALYDAMSMDARIERSLGPQRTPMALTLAFAGVAFALAVIGIYGVLASMVTQRVGEIGVRMALGARAADVVRMILNQSARLIAIGLVLGGATAIALGRVLSSQLPYVGPFNTLILFAAAIGLSAAALLASWLPARRAASIDPMRVLREQ